jgi:hypothetical protein
MRNFTGLYPDWEWGLEVRRDAGPWSYGFAVNDRAPFTFFRTDEFDINFNGGPYGTAFVEYRPDPRTSITFDIDNALNTSGNRTRLLFFPNRSDTEFAIREERTRNRHLNLGLTIKRSFGSASATAAPTE